MPVKSKVLLPFLFLALLSCRKSDKFSDIPFLEYRSYSFEQEAGTNRSNYFITLYFTDGDGDIGLEEGTPIDSCDFSEYNFLIYYYEKVDGEFVEVLPVDSCLPFHNLIPDLTPAGQNKTLEGDIIAAFPFSGLPVNPTDSIRFEFELLDRSGNRSNRLRTPAIAVED